jgi:Family of unknown function (DUF6325)
VTRLYPIAISVFRHFRWPTVSTGRFPGMDQTTGTRGLGPVELALLEFSTTSFDGSIAGALAEIVDKGLVTILDLLLVRKNADGEMTVIELEDAETDITARFDDIEGEVMWLLSDADVQGAAARLAPGTTGVIVVWENSWARDFREAVLNSGGRLVVHDHLDSDEVAAAIAATTEV